MDNKIKIVVLDGYGMNPGDLSWYSLEKLGELKVYDRTSSEKIVGRASGAEIILTNKVVHINNISVQNIILFILYHPFANLFFVV